jgi:UDP-N-acetylglucosamine 2-epimerase (non-hydrolysing)
MNKNLKKVCVVTAARSEYGLLRWVIDELESADDIQLQLIATGSHLSADFGMTYHFIEEDGYIIDEKVDMELQTEDIYSIPRSMGLCAARIAEAYRRLQPDLIVVLGDRYELLPICSTALVMNIPIAHISGGDITEGAIDNEVRNAITMMSRLHFPGTEESASRIRRMIGTDHNVFTVGEPGLDSFLRLELMSKKEIAESLNLNINKRWALITLHSETKKDLGYNLQMAHNLVDIISLYPDTEFVITKANADFGGNQINQYWDSIDLPNVTVITSLGQLRYLSFMKYVSCVIGNSSSGIVEAPFLGIPVINIGERQLGRHICRNVIQSSIQTTYINQSIGLISSHKCIDTFWGDGHASNRIVSHIHTYLYGEQ